MSLALNCNTHSNEDVEVISNLVRMRLKTKPLANHYINCIKYVDILADIQYSVLEGEGKGEGEGEGEGKGRGGEEKGRRRGGRKRAGVTRATLN